MSVHVIPSFVLLLPSRIHIFTDPIHESGVTLTSILGRRRQLQYQRLYFPDTCHGFSSSASPEHGTADPLHPHRAEYQVMVSSGALPCTLYHHTNLSLLFSVSNLVLWINFTLPRQRFNSCGADSD
jgi:hypothetical protein